MADNGIRRTENSETVPQLKPCPFCGGEAQFHIYGRSCNVACLRCQIGTRLEHIDEYEVAVEAWNTRVERTCHAVKNSRKYVLSDGTELFDDGCSICNGYIGAEENYCSNCGAKVVDE